MTIINGVLRNKVGDELYPETSAENVIVGSGDNSHTLKEILTNINIGDVKDYVLQATERVAGSYSDGIVKNLPVYRITLFDVLFPTMENDVWVPFYDATNLNIKHLFRCYGVIYDRQGNQIPVDTHNGLYFAYSSATKQIIALNTDTSFECYKGYVVLEYTKTSDYYNADITLPEDTAITTYSCDKSQGDVVLASNTSVPSTLDGPPVCFTCNNLTINAGVTLTTSQRCKGLILRVKGDLVVNGTISMTARGARGAGQYVCIDHAKQKVMISNTDVFSGIYPSERITLIHPIGGVGKVAGSNPGVNGACGSGGGTQVTYVGGYGTSFSGGAGAGGYAASSPMTTAVNGTNPAGAGGTGFSYTTSGHSNSGYTNSGGGGAGNPGGVSSSGDGHYILSTNGSSGTGGLLIAFVDGNIVIGDSGKIGSNGSAGGQGYVGAYANRVARGGSGSGGGAVHIIHKGEFTDTDKTKVTVTGGAGGAAANGGSAGYAGGAGTKHFVKWNY